MNMPNFSSSSLFFHCIIFVVGRIRCTYILIHLTWCIFIRSIQWNWICFPRRHNITYKPIRILDWPSNTKHSEQEQNSRAGWIHDQWSDVQSINFIKLLPIPPKYTQKIYIHTYICMAIFLPLLFHFSVLFFFFALLTTWINIWLACGIFSHFVVNFVDICSLFFWFNFFFIAFSVWECILHGSHFSLYLSFSKSMRVVST